MADSRAKRISQLIKPLRVKPGSKVDLRKDFDPSDKAGLLKKKDGRELLRTGVAMLADYQRRLAAQDTYGVLMCLQALDAGGKDGTIRHVMSGVNPQGVHVSNFKVPSAQRFLKRIDVPERNWKFSPADVRERAYWDEYQRAFSEMLSATSTRWAPWYVIPADRKWFARLCAAAVLVHTLIAIDPQYPEVSDATRHELGKTKRELESEAPKGVPADPYQAAAAAGNGFRSAAQRR